LAKAESIQALVDRLKTLEWRSGPRIAQQTPSRKSPRGRYWAPPKRKPASGGVLTLDTLVLAVQEIGLTARVAKKAVKTIFEEIIKWLKDGGIAETPLGDFAVVHEGRTERTLFRLGRWRQIYTKSKKVVFRPSRELLAACNRSKPSIPPIPKEISMPVSDVSLQPNQLRCEKCGSTHFVEVQFKQYTYQYSASPGGDIIPRTQDPIRVLVCLCGHPIQPKGLRSYACANYQSFKKSFAVARQYREGTSPETILRSLAEISASKQQHDALIERITKLETVLREPLPSPREPSKP
jgi:nucleoid DNA-binding protein